MPRPLAVAGGSNSGQPRNRRNHFWFFTTSSVGFKVSRTTLRSYVPCANCQITGIHISAPLGLYVAQVLDLQRTRQWHVLKLFGQLG